MTARGLHENPLTFQITHKLWLMTNHAPKLDHMDEATKGRLHLIPFDMKWNRPVDVKPDPTFPDAQKDLMDVLAGEREGILLWLIAGAVEYCKTGLAPPPEVVALTRNYLDSQDMLKSWLREYETCQPADGMVAAELFGQYRTFCLGEGEVPTIAGPAQLGKKLKALNYVSQRCRDGVSYGLRKRGEKEATPTGAARKMLAQLGEDDQPESDPADKCVTV